MKNFSKKAIIYNIKADELWRANENKFQDFEIKVV